MCVTFEDIMERTGLKVVKAVGSVAIVLREKEKKKKKRRKKERNEVPWLTGLCSLNIP